MLHTVSAFAISSSLTTYHSTTSSVTTSTIIPFLVGEASASDAGETPDLSTSIMTTLLTKNANLYWAMATSLAVWFLFIHTPKFWTRRHISRDTLLAVHIVSAAIVYLTCVHNCLLTPSMHAVTKWMHRWIGRIGLLSGLGSFSLGAFLVWSRLSWVGEGSTTMGFAIPITIGGLLQLQCEYRGFCAIRKYKALQPEIDSLQSRNPQGNDKHRLEELLAEQKEALGNHIGWLLNLFVMACGIPGGIRVAEVITRGDGGIKGILALLSTIGSLQFLAERYVRKILLSTVGSVKPVKQK